MHTLFYTIVARDNFLWLERADSKWRLGKFTRAGKLRLFSKKISLFLDADDIAMIEKVGSPKADPDPFKLDGEIVLKEHRLGSVEVLFVRLSDGSISLRIGGNDQEIEKPEVGEPYGDVEQWTEFATWSVDKGMRFAQCAHPVLRKDKTALSAAANEIAGGAGVFSGELPDDASIFTGNWNTKL